MNDEQARIVDFLRLQYSETLRLAEDVGLALTTTIAESQNIPADVAAAQARSSIHEAEARCRFLEEAIVAYLGTSGPTGRIIDRQLRLLAWEFSTKRGYDSAWRP